MSKRKAVAAAPVVDDVDETQADRELDEELDETLSIGDDDDDLWDGDDDVDEDDAPADLEERLDEALKDEECVACGASTSAHRPGCPEDPNPDAIATAACIYCGCTENKACALADGPCSWIDSDEPVCNNPACVAKHVAETQPLRQRFTPFALQGLPAKMRDRSLSSQANQWVVSSIGRLVDAQPSADSPMLSDLEALLAAADMRDIASTLSDHTLEEVRRLLAQRATAVPAEEQIHEAPIGVAGNLPGDPRVTAVVVELPIDDVGPDPDQPRDEGADDEIGQEIHGSTILPPIEVRPHPYAGQLIPNASAKPIAYPPYMIIDGERRWRGSKKAGRTTIRAIVNERPMDAGDLLLRQSALNTGKRLKPLEEARAWKRICDSKGWNASQLADYLKKPRSTVADRLAILEAPEIFRPLFLEGTLSAAAAPIVRKFVDVPESILKRALELAQDDYDWTDPIADGKAVPVKDVESILDSIILDQELREIAPALRDDYTGEVVKVGKLSYAVNIDAYDKLVEKAKPSPSSSVGAKPKREPPSKYQLEERKRMKAARQKTELRRAQFVAISKNLPTVISDAWSMPVVKWLLREMTSDTLRNASKALGLEPSKGKHGMFDFAAAILEHAEDLQVPQRTKLVIQLLLANDLYVSPHSSGGAERLSVAAKLARVDLNKVKVADPDDAPKGPVAKKAPAKKAKTPGKAKAHR